MELCIVNEMSAGNAFFGKNDIHWVCVVYCIKILLNFVLVQEEEQEILVGVNVFRNT